MLNTSPYRFLLFQKRKLPLSGNQRSHRSPVNPVTCSRRRHKARPRKRTHRLSFKAKCFRMRTIPLTDALVGRVEVRTVSDYMVAKVPTSSASGLQGPRTEQRQFYICVHCRNETMHRCQMCDASVCNMCSALYKSPCNCAVPEIQPTPGQQPGEKKTVAPTPAGGDPEPYTCILCQVNTLEDKCEDCGCLMRAQCKTQFECPCKGLAKAVAEQAQQKTGRHPFHKGATR